MYDAGKVITGIIVFLILITFPFWFNAASGRATYKPDPEIITPDDQCVETAEYMKRNHMDMLNQWRDQVVREGQRTFVAPDGKTYELSLSNTCMNCHSNKSEFCDACHNYMAVSPFCWDCHIEPQETTYGYK